MIKIFYGEYPSEHFKQEIKKADRDIKWHKHVGEIRVLSGSSAYILRICQAVRSGILRTDEVQIICGERNIDLDIKGEFIQPWPDKLFEISFYLQFCPYQTHWREI